MFAAFSLPGISLPTLRSIMILMKQKQLEELYLLNNINRIVQGAHCNSLLPHCIFPPSYLKLQCLLLPQRTGWLPKSLVISADPALSVWNLPSCWAHRAFLLAASQLDLVFSWLRPDQSIQITPCQQCLTYNVLALSIHYLRQPLSNSRIRQMARGQRTSP